MGTSQRLGCSPVISGTEHDDMATPQAVTSVEFGKPGWRRIGNKVGLQSIRIIIGE